MSVFQHNFKYEGLLCAILGSLQSATPQARRRDIETNQSVLQNINYEEFVVFNNGFQVCLGDLLCSIIVN